MHSVHCVLCRHSSGVVWMGRSSQSITKKINQPLLSQLLLKWLIFPSLQQVR